MKQFLLISLAFGFFVSSINCDLPPEEFIKFVNKVRRKTAEQEKIANMNELVYDRGLEQIMKAVKDCCHPPKQTQNGKYDMQLYKRKDTGGIMTANSASTEIASFKCRCNNSEATLVIMDFSSAGKKAGPPGSACAAGRVNKDGLCARSEDGGYGEAESEDGENGESRGDRKYPIMSQNAPIGGDGGQNGDGRGSGRGPLEATTKSISAMSVLMSIFTVIFAFFVN